MILLELFLNFLKIGLFTFGGAYGAIPLIRETVLTNAWLTEEQFSYFLAVSESTPGPIMVNMATYVGFETAGVPGAVVATLGLICPSIIIILLIARVLKQFRESKTVDAVFYGLRPCSIALIAAAGLLVARVTFLNPSALLDGDSLSQLFNCEIIGGGTHTENLTCKVYSVCSVEDC